MSVATETDNQRDMVKDDLKNITGKLAKIMADEYGGWEEYNAEYKAKVAKAFLALVEAGALL